MLGGTGELGAGLAVRWAQAGLRVIIGSRVEERAVAAAAEVGQAAGSPGAVLGMTNDGVRKPPTSCSSRCPGPATRPRWVRWRRRWPVKVLIDCVNPLGFDKQGAYALPVPEGRRRSRRAQLLPRTRVVAAFHHISAKLLADLDQGEVHADVLVLGDDRDATDLVQALAGVVPGMRGVYAGRLRNAHQVEALTANLISINRRYKAHSSIAVTDLPRP